MTARARALAIVAAALTLAALSFQLLWVADSAMAPRLVPGDVVVVDRVSYLVRLPYRGDIVITSGGRLARVEGISGDTLQTSKRTTRVPGGHVFLAGAGKVETTPLEALRGRALFIAYPLERRGWLQ